MKYKYKHRYKHEYKHKYNYDYKYNYKRKYELDYAYKYGGINEYISKERELDVLGKPEDRLFFAFLNNSKPETIIKEITVEGTRQPMIHYMDAISTLRAMDIIAEYVVVDPFMVEGNSLL